jgi:CheY-like chemotaxis protein
MPDEKRLNKPWLVAAWPGMGQVAVSAGYYLMAKLGMHPLAELPAQELFDVAHVEIKGGIIRPGRLSPVHPVLFIADFGGSSQNFHRSYFAWHHGDEIETTADGRGRVGVRSQVQHTQSMHDGDLERGEEYLMNRARPSILIVDDDLDTCRNLSDLFTDLGYQVETAHDGRSALQEVQEHPYDVGLFDYRMPGMDGLTLCREIRKLRTAMVPMIITGFAGGILEEEARTTAVSHFVPKPIDFPKLLALVDEALARPLVLVDDDPELCLTLEDLLQRVSRS